MKSVITLIVDHDSRLTNFAEVAAWALRKLEYVKAVEVRHSTTENDLITLPVIEMPEEVAR